MQVSTLLKIGRRPRENPIRIDARRHADTTDRAWWDSRRVLVLGLCLYAAAGTSAIWLLYRMLPPTWTVRWLAGAPTFSDFNLHVARGLIIPALIVPSILLAEAASVGWRGCSLRALLGNDERSIRSDLALYLLVRTPAFRVLAIVFTLGVSYLAGDGARRWLQGAAGIDLSLCWLPLPALVLAYLTIDTFFDYWSHRIQHSRLLWPIHRFHHAAEEFCVLTASRVHPGNYADVFFSTFLVGLIAVPASVFVVYSLFFSGLRYLIHSRIDSDFGWIGRYVFLSPAHHRAHHERDATAAAGNFGLVPLWDALFGTLRPPASASTRIGVDAPYRHGYWVLSDMARDSLEFARGIGMQISAHAPSRRTRATARAERARVQRPDCAAAGRSR